MIRQLRNQFALLALACVFVGTSTQVDPVTPNSSPRATAIYLEPSLPGAEESAEKTAASSEESMRAKRTKHLTTIGVEHWHKEGYRGKGIKVAILDSGFRGWQDHLGKSLPEQVTVKSFRNQENLEFRNCSQHGILCAEVIHALAPEAELLFANWEPDKPESFLNAVRWAREEGAKVITCSVIMPSWSDGEGGGPTHTKLAEILGGEGADDVLFFACAGNIALRHWQGKFTAADDGFHQWKAGVTTNALKPWNTGRVSIEVCWKGDADYEVVVEDADTNEVVVTSQPPKKDESRRNTHARFDPDKNRTYQVRVRQTRGKPGKFHFSALASDLAHSTAEGSIAFPADGAAVIAVGAVDSEGMRMEYSSCGVMAELLKPDLVATVPFPSMWRDRPFSGTSAAAPQAAALAALWRSRHPDWPAEKVRATLRQTTRDLGKMGQHDCETGYGLIQLPKE